MRRVRLLIRIVLLSASVGCADSFDVLIKSGTVYDGSGAAPFVADVGIRADRVDAIGDLESDAAVVIDANGLAVAPGFINMLSWANDSLIEDGRSQSDIRQGVTLEVLGEGWSMGPLNPQMARELAESQANIRFPVTWNTLGGYLDYLEARGISTNVASFVGATTLRVFAVGYDDRRPNRRQLDLMCDLTQQAMHEGALGLSSALIYAPGCYADTRELTALAQVVGRHGGMYISHIRSEGNRVFEALDELITIARKADVAAELYHMKLAGPSNWNKLDRAIEMVEQARADGLAITADMYTYTAGATGLDAAMPPWVQAGGHQAWTQRLRNPRTRIRVAKEMRTPTDEWENLYLLAGGAENVLLVEFKNEALRHLTGKTLAEAARMRGKSPEETAIELVVQDDSRVGAVYFLMSEQNVERQIKLPWVSFCSDSGSLAPEGVFLKSNPHPRAYGCFARLLGRYVRQRKVVPLEEAVRRLTGLPAENLKLRRRGRLAPGFCADVVVFDPDTITDNATYQQPHQYATGVVHVFVNGVQVLSRGEHTGARPGRVVRGPGWKGWSRPE